MAKRKTSARRKESSPGFKRYDPSRSLKDRNKVLKALFHCMVTDDPESFRDILIAYLRTASKTELAKKSSIGRQTLYDLMDESKPFNPTLSTLGPLFKALAA